MRFEDLQLIDSLLHAIKDHGYTEPTPIQEQAIPHVLAGRDLIGLAQTGTGKTAAFALPILQNLAKTQPQGKTKGRIFIKVLVLAPTRELATQIGESFGAYGRHTRAKHTTVFGGVGQQPQIDRLKRGVDILVATPGRLLDFMGQGVIRLDRIEVLVLDEADRMLDMGFLPDIKRIIQKVPTRRQTLLFSATMPPDIQKLTSSILVDPVEVAVAPESTTVEAIKQSVYFVEKSDKRKLLQHLLREKNMHRTLVFTRTKHGANRLSQQLAKAKFSSAAIHGNKSQSAREAALANFKRGKIQVLVATDIAARGIDVDDISHVVNFDLPNETETYVHRIGRTGRAGASGMAVSFCASEERPYLVDIERLIQMRIPVTAEHPYSSEFGIPKPTDLGNNRRSSNGQRSGNGKSKPKPHAQHHGNKNGNAPHGGQGKSKSRRRRRRSHQHQKNN
jgi:ATP-dependent RNA helicase RhlE